MTTSVGPRYRVAWPLIQIMGSVPGGREHQLERLLRQGDIVPSWVPDKEIARLLDGGFIEAFA